ncbi:NFATC2-interacting protein-like [Glandiceps talaboti]
MAEILSFSDIADSSRRNGDSNKPSDKMNDGSGSGDEVIPKKKAATKRSRPVVSGNPCATIYKIPDNIFRFDHRAVQSVLIDSDDDEEDETDSWNLSPVKKPRLRNKPKKTTVVLSSEDDDDDNEEDDDICFIGIQTPERNKTRSISSNSPSPPPSPPTAPLDIIVPASRQRQLDKVLRNVDKAMDSIYNSTVFPSPLTQSPDDCFMSPPEDKTLKVKITCKLGVVRYDMKLTDQFGVIMKSLAEKLNVEADQIILTLREDSIIASDTPKSINLRITDIIDCVVANANSMTSDNDASLDMEDPNVVHIKVQGGTKTKKIISIKKTDPMEKLMDEYSKFLDIPRNKIAFVFDGDRISPTETPQDLDMESEDVIDVLVT